jgi:transcriptional regulator with XRE-family HTH domain
MTDPLQHREALARKLKFLRMKKDWSQKQISNKIKIERSRYVNYERGIRVMPYTILLDLCGAYGLTLDQFEAINKADTLCVK